MRYRVRSRQSVIPSSLFSESLWPVAEVKPKIKTITARHHVLDKACASSSTVYTSGWILPLHQDGSEDDLGSTIGKKNVRPRRNGKWYNNWHRIRYHLHPPQLLNIFHPYFHHIYRADLSVGLEWKTLTRIKPPFAKLHDFSENAFFFTCFLFSTFSAHFLVL